MNLCPNIWFSENAFAFDFPDNLKSEECTQTNIQVKHASEWELTALKYDLSKFDITSKPTVLQSSYIENPGYTLIETKFVVKETLTEMSEFR